jgi:hypothetical protein
MTTKLSRKYLESSPADFELEFTDRARARPALFEAREPSPAGKAAFDAREPAPAAYKGVERRRKHRRTRGDRREQTRFEIDKPDRRVSEGRRAEDKSPKFW